ncbi:cytochrome P450 704C1-like protein, partial [Tanacetum coccineum]
EDFKSYKFPLFVAIVCFGQYKDDEDNREDIEYTGQGGNDFHAKDSENELMATFDIGEKEVASQDTMHDAGVDGTNNDKDDGLKIKKSDDSGYMVYLMGRMTYIWGADAEKFRPQRWLNNGVFQPKSPFKFSAFQAGPHICLRKEFAYTLLKILATLLEKN